MNDLKDRQLYNFANSKLLPQVTTTAQCTEYHEVTNLISDNFMARSRGFVADSNTRPPVEVTFKLLCPINIHHIILSRNLNHNHVLTIEILMKKGNGNFTSIAYENFTSNGLLICNRQADPLSNVDPNYHRAFFKSHASVSFSTADWVKIKIIKTERTVPSFGRVEIWGSISKNCSEDSLKAVRQLLCKEIPSVQVQELDNVSVREDFEIPEDFKDALTFEVMAIPITLPSGNTIDQTTLDKCIQNDVRYGRGASDPFTGQNFNDTRKPVLNVALKHRIDMFLLQNAHRKETYSIQRTVGGVKRKAEIPVSVKKVVVCDKYIVGRTSEETLNLAIEKVVNSKGFIRFTDEKKDSETRTSCVQCSSGEYLYTIPCNHYYCKNCLLIIYKTLKCGLCEKSFQKTDPRKLNL